MKKMLLVGFLMFFLLSFFSCNSLNNPKNVTASKILNLRNGSYVKVVGTIESILLFEFYLFSDGTESISVEVTDAMWESIGMSPDTVRLPARFEIIGRVDKRPNEEAVITSIKIKAL